MNICESLNSSLISLGFPKPMDWPAPGSNTSLTLSLTFAFLHKMMPPQSLMNVASENLILRLSSKLSQGCALVPPEDAALKCKIICATRGDEIHLISFFKDAAMPERGFGVWTDTFQPEMRSHLTGPGVILISLFVCSFQREWCPTSTVQPYQPCCCQVECTFSAPMPSAGQQIVLFICPCVFSSNEEIFFPDIWSLWTQYKQTHTWTGGCQTESGMQACLLYGVGLYPPCCNRTASSRRWVRGWGWFDIPEHLCHWKATYLFGRQEICKAIGSFLTRSQHLNMLKNMSFLACIWRNLGTSALTAHDITKSFRSCGEISEFVLRGWKQRRICLYHCVFYHP